MKDMVGEFSVNDSNVNIRYKKEKLLKFFVFDDVFVYIRKDDRDYSRSHVNRVLNCIDNKYTRIYPPDDKIFRNEAFLIGTQQEDVICISKFGIKELVDNPKVEEICDINKILTLIEYLDKNF